MKQNNRVLMHQKRYGQFFSGKKIADLLVSLLPFEKKYNSIIDPMAGTGDLLRAVLPRAKKDSTICGIEIDNTVADSCKIAVPDAEIICDDAFCAKKLITQSGWDLVIANPPYVRYQLQSHSHKEIKNSLCETISMMSYLCEEDKLLMLNIAQNYSGLSDLAVPSWILIAALVKMNGYMAMVVPETWLSRDYAKPIQYLLTKCFDIQVIARDISACWFNNALVRTCLVIAQRRKQRTLKQASNQKTLLLDFEASLTDSDSLIGKLSWDGKQGMEALSALLQKKPNVTGSGFASKIINTISLYPYMIDNEQKPAWVLYQDYIENVHARYLPDELMEVTANYSGEYIDLNQIGLSFGQGLRTGANQFFYLKILKKTNAQFVLQGNSWYNNAEILAPKNLIHYTLQNRGEVEGLVVDQVKISTGLLYIQDSIRKCDLCHCDQKKAQDYSILDKSLDDYITSAELYKNNKGIAFNEYSAVKPNERKSASGYSRFWYMLPKLTSRHTSNLCINRVNSTNAECIYVPQKKSAPIIVDANFVTIWCADENLSKLGFALLNSTWSKCFLELTCTVMGGGALKIEASNLKNLRFPKYNCEQLKKLTMYGSRMIEMKQITPELQNEIDKITLEPFENSDEVLLEVKDILSRKLTERGAK